jgi:transposase
MEVVHTHCAGLDVHKKTVTACALTPSGESGWKIEIRTFGTMTSDVLGLADWLAVRHITHVAMESTGDYWKPIHNLLEGAFEVLLVNAAHVKHVPGRKTDIKDAQWLAELLQHGLLRASFVPPPPIRELREMTRSRATFVRERATLVNRVQKVLESANIKLASVATDVMGVSGRAMLTALCGGQTDPHGLAELSKGRLRAKRDELAKALEGRVKPHHRFILTELLCQIDGLDETITRFDREIEDRCRPFEEAVVRLDTIPGVGRDIAEVIVSEIGVDMGRFPSAAHLAAWAGVAPGNHESAGKRLSGRTRKGNQTLRKSLVQAAHAAARTKQTFLSAQYHRLAGRRGKKRAVMAVAHSILVIAYHLISRQEEYKELGSAYVDRQHPERTIRRLMARLETLGVSIPLPGPKLEIPM